MQTNDTRRLPSGFEDGRVDIRKAAIPEVAIAEGRTFQEIPPESYRGADPVFLGPTKPEPDFSTCHEALMNRTSGLHKTLLVLTVEDLAFRAVQLEARESR